MKKLFCFTLIFTLSVAVGIGESFFPTTDALFGVPMPSLSSVINRPADECNADSTGSVAVYHQVTDNEYEAFSRYLKSSGCVASTISIENRTLVTEVEKDGVSMIFTYDYPTQTATILYPVGTRMEDTASTTEQAEEGILPSAIDAFDIEDPYEAMIPSVEMAIGLREKSISILEDGSIEETFPNFTDSDYEAFSNYIQAYGCALSDYSVDDAGVLTINLEKNSIPFAFVYDRADGTAEIRYSADAQVEPAPTPTPEPVVATTTVPDSDGAHKVYYSESDCWSTAKTYFEALSWKNPSSLTIHGHTSTLSNGSYIFRIDYSAQNGFGGYNRSTAIVTVSRATNTVISCWVDQ